MKRYIFILLIYISATSHAQVFISRSASSQVEGTGLFGKSETINKIVLPTLDINKTIKELQEEDQKIPGVTRLGKSIAVNIFPLTEGTWESFGQYKVLRLKLSAPNASSLTLTFDQLKLLDSTELYIYNELGTILTGPISQKDNIKIGGRWRSNVFPNNTLIIELKVRAGMEKSISLHISNIMFGIKRPLSTIKGSSDSLTLGFGSSSECNLNIVCSNSFDIERKAVCLIDLDGAYGSGFLVNTTCDNMKGYVQTAEHNVTFSNTSNWTFTFLWWSPTCTTNTNVSKDVMYNGAVLRASWPNTDMGLVELTTSLSNSTGHNLSFLGWTRSTSTPSSTTGIHHPYGDQMKICGDSASPTIGNINSYTNTAWRAQFDYGTVQGGSSGSPLLNQNALVIGQLYSTTQPTSSPCNQATGGANYGRFDLSWDGGGTSSTRLKDWLDPSSTNTTSVSSISEDLYYVDGSNTICGSSENYAIGNLPSGTTVTWSVSGNVVTTSGAYPLILTRVSDGYATITATFTLCGNTITRTKTVTVGAPGLTFSLSPSSVQILCGTQKTQTYTVSTSGTTSCTISYNWYLGSGNGWTYNGSPAPTAAFTAGSSITLTSLATNNTFSNISVTPVVGSIARSALTATTTFQAPNMGLIGGSNSICSGTSSSFSLYNAPSNSSYYWGLTSLLPNYGATVASVDNQYNSYTTLTKINSGVVNLTAYVTDACSQTYSVTRQNIMVGGYTQTELITGYTLAYPPCFTQNCTPSAVSNSISDNGPYGTIVYSGDAYNGCTNYLYLYNSGIINGTWSLNQGTVASWSSSNGNNLQFYPGGLSEDYVQFRLTVSTSCGNVYYHFYFYPTSYYYSSYYMMAPNPVTSEFTVSVDEKKLEINNIPKTSDQDIKEVIIIDKMGQAKLRQIGSAGTRQMRIYVSNLSTGYYILRIFNGKDWKSLPFIKQ